MSPHLYKDTTNAWVRMSSKNQDFAAQVQARLRLYRQDFEPQEEEEKEEKGPGAGPGRTGQPPGAFKLFLSPTCAASQHIEQYLVLHDALESFEIIDVTKIPKEQLPHWLNGVPTLVSVDEHGKPKASTRREAVWAIRRATDALDAARSMRNSNGESLCSPSTRDIDEFGVEICSIGGGEEGELVACDLERDRRRAFSEALGPEATINDVLPLGPPPGAPGPGSDRDDLLDPAGQSGASFGEQVKDVLRRYQQRFEEPAAP